MKIKGLIILSVICIIILIMVRLSSPPTSEITPQTEKETIPTGQTTNFSSTIPAPIIINTTSAPSKSAITIVNKPDSQKIAKPANQIVVSENNNFQSTLPGTISSSVDNSKTQDNPQMGITKIGKQPTPKESHEMNSQGIVLY
jgi:hypothetical protein